MIDLHPSCSMVWTTGWSGIMARPRGGNFSSGDRRSRGRRPDCWPTILGTRAGLAVRFMTMEHIFANSGRKPGFRTLKRPAGG